jgi:hypothetical protein
VYPFGIYNHQCWPTEDDAYLLCDDEFNVVDLLVFDIRDLSNISTYTPYNTSPARIHNVFVQGAFAHVSYYTDGYVRLAIPEPATPVLCGSYDTLPSAQSNRFDGAWGVYPYAPSGNVYVSDISSGLYVIANDPPATDTDGDSVGDSCDLDDDGDRVPDTVELDDGSDPLVPDVLLHLSTGLNLVSFPVEPALDSYQWLAALGPNVRSVSRIGAGSQHEAAIRLPDGTLQGLRFALTAHTGYLVQMAAPAEHHATGILPGPPAAIPAGVSVRGFAYLPGEMTAHRLLAEPGFAGVVHSIGRFDRATARFESAAVTAAGPVGPDFQVIRGEAYLLSAVSGVQPFP